MLSKIRANIRPGELAFTGVGVAACGVSEFVRLSEQAPAWANALPEPLSPRELEILPLALMRSKQK